MRFNSWLALIGVLAFGTAGPMDTSCADDPFGSGFVRSISPMGLASNTNGQYREMNEAPIDPVPLNQFAAPGPSSDDLERSLEQRLSALEKAYQKDRGAAGETSSEGRKGPSVSGRIHIDYVGIPDAGAAGLVNALETNSASPATRPEDRFLFRRIRLACQGDIADNMVYRIDFELADPNSPAIRDLYLGWNELPLLQTFLIGNQRRPYGLDSLNSSNQNIFMERPLIVDAFNQNLRRLGIASYGVSDDQAWNWRFGTFLMDDIQNDDGTFGSSTVAPAHGDHYQLELAGRLAHTFWYDVDSGGRGYGHWGIVGSVGEPDGTAGTKNAARFRTRPEARTDSRWFDTGFINNAETMELVGCEGIINIGSLHVCAEFQQNWIQARPGGESSFHGGYIQAAYFLTGEHMPWDRKMGTLDAMKPFQNFFRVRTDDDEIESGWGAWQIAARYSHADFSDGPFQGGIGDALTGSLNWYWNSNARWQFNYVYGMISSRTGNGVPVGIAGTQGDYHIFSCRFQVGF